jgi:hypothetical protein
VHHDDNIIETALYTPDDNLLVMVGNHIHIRSDVERLPNSDEQNIREGKCTLHLTELWKHQLFPL